MADYTKPNVKMDAKADDVPEMKPKRKQIVSGKTKARKENGFVRLAKVFASGDVEGIFDIIIDEVVIPAIRDTIYNSVENGLHILLYGNTKAQSKTSRTTVSYNRYYDRGGSNARTTSVADDRERNRARLPKCAEGLRSREEAEDLRYELEATIEDYTYATVSDLKEFMGEETVSTDNKYGWYSLEKAKIRSYRDTDEETGRMETFWELVLPRAMPIDRE